MTNQTSENLPDPNLDPASKLKRILDAEADISNKTMASAPPNSGEIDPEDSSSDLGDLPTMAEIGGSFVAHPLDKQGVSQGEIPSPPPGSADDLPNHVSEVDLGLTQVSISSIYSTKNYFLSLGFFSDLSDF